MADHFQLQHRFNTKELIEFGNGIRLRLFVPLNEHQWHYFRGLTVSIVYTFGEFQDFATNRQLEAHRVLLDRLGR